MKTRDNIIFIQKKFRNRHLYRVTKALLIDDLWRRVLVELREKASEAGGRRECDKRILRLCDAIDEVPKEIRLFVLTKYQMQMDRLSWIYCFHTRRIERSEVCDHDEIQL
jgi:hypothetical protein